MVHLRKLLTASLAVLLLAAPPASAQNADDAALRKIDRSLRQALRQNERSAKRIIVTVTPGHRQDIRRTLEAHGDTIVADVALIDALAAEVHGADVLELAKHPWVLAVADDATVFAGAASTKDKGAKDKAKDKANSVLRETLGLPKVPTSTTPIGSGVGVVLIDSGIAPIKDFDGRISAFYDFTRHGKKSEPYDDFGHGTHIAGLIGSSGALSSGELTGVAPGVHFIGLKVLDRKGQGRTSDVIGAIEFAVANKRRLRAHVMNISLGHPIYAPAKHDPLVQAVEKAVAAGFVVVVSAGNIGQNSETGDAGYTGITSPGNAPSAITVGAADTRGTIGRDDVVAPYSSRGPTWFDAFAKPDVVAPGHRLMSNLSPSSYFAQQLRRLTVKHTSALGATPERALIDNNLLGAADDNIVWGTGLFDNIVWGTGDNIIWGTRLFDNIVWGTGDNIIWGTNDNIVWGTGAGSFFALSGASMAAGVTTGVVATLLEANRTTNVSGTSLAPNAVKALLQFSAIPVEGADSLTQGTGEVSAAGAIELARAINNAAQPGDYWLQSGVAAVSDIGGDLYPWSKSVIWGHDVLTGDLVYHNMAAWSVTAQWGLDNIVWGTGTSLAADNIVWGTASVWAWNIVWNGRVIGQWLFDNIVWGIDNIVWGMLAFDNIV